MTRRKILARSLRIFNYLYKDLLSLAYMYMWYLKSVWYPWIDELYLFLLCLTGKAGAQGEESQGLVANMAHLKGQVPFSVYTKELLVGTVWFGLRWIFYLVTGTSCMNQNLDPTGCPTGLDFSMMVGSSHKGTWSLGLVTNLQGLLSSCMPTLSHYWPVFSP